jgi:DNA replication initiation complex subunit (GINS family)
MTYTDKDIEEVLAELKQVHKAECFTNDLNETDSSTYSRAASIIKQLRVERDALRKQRDSLIGRERERLEGS